MLNLIQEATNSFIVYSDTTGNSPYYLIELKNGWNNYIYPAILRINKQNSRYIEFQLDLTTSDNDNPLNSLLFIPAVWNYDYKIWNIPSPSLSPLGGTIFDAGQAFLEITDNTRELYWDYYISDNETAKTKLFYSPLQINYASETEYFLIYRNGTTFNNNFLFGFLNGFTNEWTYVNPTVTDINDRFINFGITFVSNPINSDPQNGIVYLQPNGNYDYKVFRTPTSSLTPITGSVLLYEGQYYLSPDMITEINPVVYISDNEQSKRVVYYTDSHVWNTTNKFWELADFNWES